MAEAPLSSPRAARPGPPLRPPSTPRRVGGRLPLLQAIISGGQTGADQAGLRAAKLLGLATGGRAPRGFRTLAGPSPWLGTEYGLIECWSPNYAVRTARCVHAADAVVRIASDFGSAGERCTLRAIKKYDRPHLNVVLSKNLHAIGYGDVDRGVHYDQDDGCAQDNAAALLRAFLIQHAVRVLNVAGNSEQTAPGIGQVAEAFLLRALSEDAP